MNTSDDDVILVGECSPIIGNSVITLSDDEEEEVPQGSFFNKELNMWIDIETDGNWHKIDFTPNIEYIYKKLKEFYFGNKYIDEQYQILYDIDNVIIDGSAFKISESLKKVIVSQSILVRPRVQQISTLLHILIHLFLYKISNGTIGLHKHDENFRSIMLYINNRIRTSISFNHKFAYSEEEDEYSKHWYSCSGVCNEYEPFHGLIRSIISPSSTMLFWQRHQDKCGGEFFRVFEIQKTNTLNEVEKIYVKHRCYMNPKEEFVNPTRNGVKVAPKFPVRMKIDITNDIGSPIVRNLYDVIDLDDSQYEYVETEGKYFLEFKKLVKNEEKCPLCLTNVLNSRLPSHFDSCMGPDGITVNHCIPYRYRN